MSALSQFLKKSKVKRFKKAAMDKQNLNIYEQMSEFMTTNGDEYILPYLNKFEKLTLSQSKAI